MGIEDNSEQQLLDVFDMLPDALVFEIFNRVEDAKSLSACAVLCKRFGNLVAQTHNVSLEITRRNTLPELTYGSGLGWDMNKSKGFVGRFILKPIHALFHRIVSRKSKACSNCCDDDEDNMFRLPSDLLKSFNEIRSLSVKLPGHDGDISPENNSGALLKWKAEFGKELESCVILGATGFHKSEPKPKIVGEPIPAVSVTTHLTNKQLKKRVIWTISCLIASSARHHMLKQIISSNQTIRDVKIIDGSRQGNIQMTEKQVVELRSTMAGELDRTRVPAVTIKMWYMPMLELPESGGVMKGATLAVIRPTAAAKDDDVRLASGAFEEDFAAEAVRKLVDNKKSYTLEMNSF
ncbi:F-box protein At5g46170-like [Bidens hawaiensis]|uniref:F-box protein At5g46170-like n=1 Tax=Bidens hawaiensis TaxID=980011 RepID=UPI004049CA53